MTPLTPVYAIVVGAMLMLFSSHRARLWAWRTAREAATKASDDARGAIVKWAGLAAIGIVGSLTVGEVAMNIAQIMYAPVSMTPRSGGRPSVIYGNSVGGAASSAAEGPAPLWEMDLSAGAAPLAAYDDTVAQTPQNVTRTRVENTGEGGEASYRFRTWADTSTSPGQPYVGWTKTFADAAPFAYGDTVYFRNRVRYFPDAGMGSGTLDCRSYDAARPGDEPLAFAAKYAMFGDASPPGNTYARTMIAFNCDGPNYNPDSISISLQRSNGGQRCYAHGAIGSPTRADLPLDTAWIDIQWQIVFSSSEDAIDAEQRLWVNNNDYANPSCLADHDALSASYVDVQALPNNPIITTDASTTVRFRDSTSVAGRIAVGDRVSITGVSGDVNGVPVGELNAVHYLTAINGDTASFVVTTAATSTGTGGGSSAQADYQYYNLSIVNIVTGGGVTDTRGLRHGYYHNRVPWWAGGGNFLLEIGPTEVDTIFDANWAR